ncbi:MAG: bifunctional folylpolyglutamate synthase/dihydrofolate synthase [Sulfurovum sp.]|nr:bifunctional folylpolyglutamate synthase/dihydrofolate synthase [Sulfurovum sp.]
MSLLTFLDAKPLYYKEIDHERVHIAYGSLKPHISRPKTVHVVGTNGKGSTGRMFAHLAYKSGLRVGHYTSPHIISFNERIWVDGAYASDEVLEEAHQKLYGILGQEMSEALSYFEYTTLLAFVVCEACDLMVLEAGLGGEFDATNVCEKELSIITPIGLDHQAFLGQTIEEIATTKINSIQDRVVLAPQPYEEVVDVAKRITEEKGAELCRSGYPYPDIKVEMNESVGVGTPRPTELEQIALDKGWPEYLIDNAMVALEALEIMEIPYDLNDLKSVELFGRFYRLKENIRIDVGHNPLAAQAIVKAMEPETVLIYNSLDDKDYETVLRTLKPKVKRVEIIKINSQRATTLDEIEQALQRVGLEYRYYNGKIERDEHYLVFGSFYVVEEFLRSMESDVSE